MAHKFEGLVLREQYYSGRKERVGGCGLVGEGVVSLEEMCQDSGPCLCCPLPQLWSPCLWQFRAATWPLLLWDLMKPTASMNPLNAFCIPAEAGWRLPSVSEASVQHPLVHLLIHDVYIDGNHMKEVNSFLWSFRLSSLGELSNLFCGRQKNRELGRPDQHAFWKNQLRNLP